MYRKHNFLKKITVSKIWGLTITLAQKKVLENKIIPFQISALKIFWYKTAVFATSLHFAYTPN